MNLLNKLNDTSLRLIGATTTGVVTTTIATVFHSYEIIDSAMYLGALFGVMPFATGFGAVVSGSSTKQIEFETHNLQITEKNLFTGLVNLQFKNYELKEKITNCTQQPYQIRSQHPKS